MTISYNWLHDYLPVKIEPERLSKILTSIGLEVESLEKYESIKGGLEGLLVGEVLECTQHPNADKLKLTKVDIGEADPLQIVCGASNVAAGQKVVVAKVGTTIYPKKGEPITMKIAKIRGSESFGMICAEDEIGLGDSHEGIIVLPTELKSGSPLSFYIKTYNDYIYEIGLTPNHMDAMSHWGAARDVCAYLSHHDKNDLKLKLPSVGSIKPDNNKIPITVSIENKTACQRYSGISIEGIHISPSPQWMQDKLKAIGVRPINNIVDITNFVLHETGQPLHAFDADEIKGNKIIVKNLPEGTPFITLDEKERKLSADDLMICNEEEGMCIAGVFGGLKSGVKPTTKNIFLESAWFNPTDIRKTSFRHGLRTDAATHFEKGMDISGTVTALKRASLLIKELAGGEFASEIVDVYPDPKPKTEIALRHHYLKKLSGKNYHPDSVKNILASLGFEIIKEGLDDIQIKVPYHKPDISLPADVVEEIMRMDGYDNIQIPSSITISPSIEAGSKEARLKEKTANYLVGQGFYETFTNSITNSAYFQASELEHAVKMINNLSAELNIMRPSMLETGLESIAHNLNRKVMDLKFFEFGKSYSSHGAGHYAEKNHLCLYITGSSFQDSWKTKPVPSDLYYIKGICNKISSLTNAGAFSFSPSQQNKLATGLTGKINEEPILELGMVDPAILRMFDIKQPVYFADFSWDELMLAANKNNIEFKELPKLLPVHRDLAMVVDKSVQYQAVESVIEKTKLPKLEEVKLFDIFESDKLGAGKKSLAISLRFLDNEKTLTDTEVDGMVGKIMLSLEKELNAEIRK